MNCIDCRQLLERYLSDVPANWRLEMVNAICKAIEQAEIDCDDIKNCETITRLTHFTRTGNVVSITYIDETETPTEVDFDFSDLLESSLDGVDPKCLMSQDEWDNLSYAEKWESIIRFRCDCCKN